MDYVLVVSGSDKNRGFFTQVLKESSFSQISFISSGNEARRTLNSNDFDLVVINAPLPDEFGHDLALTVIETTSAGVIMLVKSDIAEEVEAKVEDFGVFVLPKPLNRQMFYHALKLMAASRRRVVGLKMQNVKLQNKLEELRLVDRAKCSLIQYLNMTEPQAHRYIEKQAMDMRTSKGEIAQNILRNYEA